MSHHEDGDPLLHHPLEHILQELSGPKIEIAEWLIQHEEIRLLGDVMGDHHLLLLAAAEGAYGFVCQVLDTYCFYRPLHGIIVGLLRAAQQSLTAKASHHHHLLGGERGEWIEIEVLNDIAHPPSHLKATSANIQAADTGPTMGDLDQAVDRLQQGGLSRAVRAADDHILSPINLQGKILDNRL